MIELNLMQILDVIQGSVIKGNEDSIILHISTGGIMKKCTLFIDKYKRQYSSLELFKKFNGTIIVTQDSEKFKRLDNSVTIVKVEDIEAAYWKFVEYYRSLISIPIIGITGTCGKTTTKEMIKHILSNKYNVCSTINSNNDAYLDIYYLTSINEKTDVGIFEMGVSHPNNLVNSCRLYKPQIRLLLNIGVYHLEGCITPENYLKAKAKIIEGLNEIDGVLILNADDDNIKKIDISKISKVIYFSLNKKTDFTGSNIEYSIGGMYFTVTHEAKDYKAYIPMFGKHNVYNAIAAIAAVSNVGVSADEAIERLKTFKAVEEHLEMHSGANGCTIIDDTWSSAPPSVVAALDTTKEISNKKRIIALIGTSPQLGSGFHAEKEYSKIGEKVVETGIDTLVVVGDKNRTIGLSAIELGMKKENVYFSDNADEIYSIIKPFLCKDTVILLKITHRQMVDPAFVELKNKLINSSS